LPETIEELYDTLDAADKHTVFLMGKIEELEAKIANLEAELKAARFAAETNWSALKRLAPEVYG
jgi:hypothetical protein